MTTGQRFRAARERLGLSSKEAAEALGVHPSRVANVEADRPDARATLDWLHAAAVKMGIDPHDLDPRLASVE